MKTIKDILYKVSVEGVLGTTSNTVSGIYFEQILVDIKGVCNPYKN